MVAGELERISDYCVGIARITLMHDGRPLLKPLVDIPRMAQLVRTGLREAVDALLTKNAELAEAIARRDDEIDQLYDQVYRELLTYMLCDPQTMDRATWLLWVAHNLERMGDRIQNVCERTVYDATGVMREFTDPEAVRDRRGSRSSAGDEARGAGTPGGRAQRVLFLCIHNSARSQMAEGLLRAAAPDRFEAFSAGLEAGSLRPEAIAVMREIGIDISAQRSKSVDDFAGRPFDIVVTTCDEAKEACPLFPGATSVLHWSFPDPAAVEGDEATRLAAFRQVRDGLKERIDRLARHS